jgi:hypothetical protein
MTTCDVVQDMGDKARVLAEIVPYLAAPYTARALINSCLTGKHRNAETVCPIASPA